jgi:O-antigen/teichoic acid export membrane protein
MLTLAWVVVGYFGLFDFGLSRALTKLVAEKLGKSDASAIPHLVWTSVVLMGAIGLVGTAVMAGLSPWVVRSIAKMPPNLKTESLHAFYWLSASVPIVIVTAGLRGVLEAFQRFRLATAIRIPLGIFSYLGPVLVLPFSHSLVPIVAVLVVGRTVACAAHFWACYRGIPELRVPAHFDKSEAGSLFRFGTWITVSNVVGPMMVTFDRFVIGAFVSVSAIAYYAVPAEVVTKLLILPNALIAVVYPAFSTAHAGRREQVATLFDSSIKLVCVAMFPLILAVVIFAPEGLRLWLGADFAAHSVWIVRWLAIAVFINSLAQVPFAHLQGAGRPDIPAKIHLLELPLYIGALFLLVNLTGIQGAAIAWLLRVAVDSLLLFVLSKQLDRESGLALNRALWLLGVGVALLLLGSLDMTLGMKALAMVVMSAGPALLLWRWMLSPKEQALLRSLLRGSNVPS